MISLFNPRGWLQPLSLNPRGWLLILAVWLLFSFPYFFQGKTPFPSTYQVTFFPPWSAAYGMPVKNNAMPDVITQIYPWKVLTINTWKRGEIPLWNPYSFAGTPHAANYQTAVFSPLNLLFFVLPYIDAWTLFILLQPLLAGLFMYLFLGTLVKDPFGRLIGTIAFMFCGFLVVWMAYGTLGYAALFLPLILWGIRTKHPAAVSAGIALSFLSGHFQISLYVFAMSLAWAIFERGRMWRFLLLGLLIASPQLLLSYDAYRLSVRSALFQAGEIIPWQYLTTLLAPDFYGNPVTRNDWFGHYAEWASFVGVIPLLFALWALVVRRTQEVRFFGAAAIVALLLATPGPLVSLLYWAKIPVLSTSAASRIIILFSFALAVLSAFGFEALRAQWKKRITTRVFIFVGVAVLLVGLIWAGLLSGVWLAADKLGVAKRNFFLPTGFVVLTSAIFLLGHVKKKWLTVGLSLVLVLLALGDSLRFAVKWMPADPKELVSPQMSIIDELTRVAGNNRVFGNFGAELAVPNRIQALEGYDALYPARYGEFLMSANGSGLQKPVRSVAELDNAGVHAEKLLSLTGTRFILHRKSDGRAVWTYPVWEYPHYEKIYEDETYEIYENGNALPRAFLASDYAVIRDDAAILNKLWSDETSLRNTIILERQPDPEPVPGDGSAEILSYAPTVVTIRTKTDAQKLLFLSDAYDEGWKARIDETPAEIYRADYVFRAVPVPPGEHIVTMRYQPLY